MLLQLETKTEEQVRIIQLRKQEEERLQAEMENMKKMADENKRRMDEEKAKMDADRKRLEEERERNEREKREREAEAERLKNEAEKMRQIAEEKRTTYELRIQKEERDQKKADEDSRRKIEEERQRIQAEKDRLEALRLQMEEDNKKKLAEMTASQMTVVQQVDVSRNMSHTVELSVVLGNVNMNLFNWLTAMLVLCNSFTYQVRFESDCICCTHDISLLKLVRLSASSLLLN